MTRKKRLGLGAAVVAGSGAVIYLLAYAGGEAVRDRTAPEITELLKSGEPPAAAEVATMVNRLDFEGRMELFEDAEVRRWWTDLPREERVEFARRTRKRGRKLLLDKLRQLPEEERKKTVDDLVERMRENRQRLIEELDEEDRQLKLSREEIRRAVREFLEGTTSDERGDLAPVEAEMLDALHDLQTSGRLELE